MDHHHHIAGGGEERLVNDRLRHKLNQVNTVAQSHLSPIQDHINFTLQQAYFQCAYECFDRRKNHDEISNCVENCSVPVLTAQNLVENEMARFQERMSRSMAVCQDKYEAAKIQPNSDFAIKNLESCVEHSIEESISLLPHVAAKLKGQLNMKD